MDEDTTHGEEAADVGGIGPFATVSSGTDPGGTPTVETALTRDPSAAVPPRSVPDDTSTDAAGQAATAALDEELRTAIAERDARIGELEAQIEEASRSVEAVNALAAQIEELRQGAEAEREGFELKMAGCRSVKAARALLSDYGGDVDALAAAEPWLFGAEAAQSGVTGLPSAGAAGGGDEAETARWREIAGLE